MIENLASADSYPYVGPSIRLWQGLQLRCALEQRGLKLPKGFHAKNDSHATRDEVFAVVGEQGPRRCVFTVR